MECWFFSIAQRRSAIYSNAVGRRWTKADFPNDMHNDGDHVFCLGVQGMGDLNGVDVAQLTHEWILRLGNVFDDAQQLIYGCAVPSGRMWFGVYVDDWFCVYRCL